MLLLSSADITWWFTDKNQATYKIILFHYTCHFHLLCWLSLQMHTLLTYTGAMKSVEEFTEKSHLFFWRIAQPDHFTASHSSSKVKRKINNGVYHHLPNKCTSGLLTFRGWIISRGHTYMLLYYPKLTLRLHEKLVPGSLKSKLPTANALQIYDNFSPGSIKICRACLHKMY